MNCPKCGVDWRVRGCDCQFSSLARTLTSKRPCPYCGRTSQTASHVNCDGCGAPKDAKHFQEWV
jgi:ribosomal protein S27AE